MAASQPTTTGVGSLESLKSFTTPKYLTKDQVLSDPTKMDIIRNMMATSTDSIYKNKPDPRFPDRTDVKTDDEVYDAFTTHMRWVNSNEAYTAKEAIDVFGADDRTKASYGEAYKLYDQIDDVASSEGTLGTLRAAKDYGLGIVTSPSTWLSFGIGKMFGKASTTAGKEAIMLAAEKAAEGITKQMAAKGATKTAIKTANREVVRAAAKVSARKAITINAAADMSFAQVQDVLYQKTMQEAGAQDEFSVAQNVVSTLLGGTSAAFAITHARPIKGATGLEGAGEKIVVERKARASSAGKKVAKDVKRVLIQNQVDWIKLAEEGGDLANNPELRQSVFKWFTDTKDPDSLVSLLQKNGADLKLHDSNSFSESLVRFAEGMDDEARKEINEAFEPLGITFTQVTQIFANVARSSGQNFKGLSDASKFLENFRGITITNKQAAQGVIDASEELVQDKAIDKQTLKYWQTVWKRALISTPATSIVNIKGWGIMQAIKAPSQALQMAALYGLGGGKKILGVRSADATLGQARALLKNLGYMARIAVDPFTTVEAFSALVDNAPKNIQREVHHHFFQGVEMAGGPEKLGMNPKNLGIKATEWYLTTAQRWSLVHSQDVMTKAISGVTELDKQTRLHLGASLDEILNSSRIHEITDEMWDNAVRVLQEDTFSKSFAGDKGIFGSLASISQQISHHAIGGFIWPFGQFVNSMLSFSWKHSPLGLIEPAMKIIKGKGDLNAGERLSRAIVGSSILGVAYFRERDKQKEGLQWFEERDADGAVHRVDNMFPLGLINITARILYNQINNGAQDADLYTDLGKQLAVPAALKDLGAMSILTEFGSYLKYEKDVGTSVVQDLVMKAATSLSGIAGGFTRPLDPINDLTGAYLDAQGVVNSATPDKKQVEGLDGVAMELTRYTNNFFSLLVGEEDETGRRMVGKPKHSATQEGEIKSGNAVMGVLGTPYEQKRTSIDTLLGMVDKPPFKVDSFSSGNAEYDDFVNQAIFPILEREAKRLLANPVFKNSPHSVKMQTITDMLRSAEQEVLTNLDSGLVGTDAQRVLVERKKLLSRPKNDIRRAKQELGIVHKDHELTMFEIEQIKEWIKLDDKIIKKQFGY